MNVLTKWNELFELKKSGLYHLIGLAIFTTVIIRQISRVF